MNTDLERELRDLLSEEAGTAPAPHETGNAVRRTRRRQALTALTGVVGVAAIALATMVGVRALDRADPPSPGDDTMSVSTWNGISISHPTGWFVPDPDEAGLNGPSDVTGMQPPLPRIVLAVAPFDPGEYFSCPEFAETPHTFLMTVQQVPLALSGPDASPWPVNLQRMDLELGGTGCYTGWELHRAGWTAGGRTFEARVGFAPEGSEEDRAALLAAFASLTFAPAGEPATSVVIGSGEVGGEVWELIASKGTDGLGLSLQAESWGGGIGGFDPEHWSLRFVERVIVTVPTGSGSRSLRSPSRWLRSRSNPTADRSNPTGSMFRMRSTPTLTRSSSSSRPAPAGSFASSMQMESSSPANRSVPPTGSSRPSLRVRRRRSTPCGRRFGPHGTRLPSTSRDIEPSTRSPRTPSSSWPPNR